MGKKRHYALILQRFPKSFASGHELARESLIRRRPAYRDLMRHRRLDRLTQISNPKPEVLGRPADFPYTSIQKRIELGYENAQRMLRLRAPGSHYV